VLTPPAGLSEDALASELARGWELTAASMIYRAVGFGSYHWEVTDAGGTRWFVTADDLRDKRRSLSEPLTAAFDRLRAALTAASDLRDHDRPFVVAPVRTRAGEPLVRANDGFGVALYPFIEGQSFAWGEFSGPAHRLAILDLIIWVHTAPRGAGRHACTDDFAVPHRDELEAALAGPPAGEFGELGDFGECGPFGRPAALLLAEHAGPVRRLLARHDGLVAASHAQPSRRVLTHGETHPGNTMLTPGGWLLIDWDTALLAPPERDLWNVDLGDGSILSAYAEATGVTPLPAMLELYRMQWDLADLAVTVSGFRRQHWGSSDDQQSWEILSDLVARISA
jgi:Phosphotransferase enzyme family